ncbi:LacI family DNA-binding transcriptional regulator [Exiguobacterium sp.]|nr:LacI family DNA-binding transcriptional regulator [Exiguobacterium sp. UBA3491]
MAKQAGVSKSTVSRVLNGHKHVSKKATDHLRRDGATGI